MEQSGLVPLHVDDEISSLSAILLNEAYYQMLVAGRKVTENVVILAPEYLILFKAKAWLELSERKLLGQHVDSHDIKKHKNDIIRLATILTGKEQCNLPETVKIDMRNFINRLREEELDFKALQVSGFTKKILLDLFIGFPYNPTINPTRVQNSVRNLYILLQTSMADTVANYF